MEKVLKNKKKDFLLTTMEDTFKRQESFFSLSPFKLVLLCWVLFIRLTWSCIKLIVELPFPLDNELEGNNEAGDNKGSFKPFLFVSCCSVSLSLWFGPFP